jgi:UDP-2-acetamido-3-amino-2,3-dideoxy-glucuronate N-acetyltransferase
MTALVDPTAVIDAAVTLGDGVEIGAGARLLGPLSIGRGAIVRAGSVVTESVPPNAIVEGDPARIVAYVDDAQLAAAGELVEAGRVGAGATGTRVRGVTLQRVTSARDLRGSLAAAEFADLPFEPRRVFVVYDVPSESVRGEHAHRTCGQFLVCLRGSVRCLVDDGTTREDVQLSTPDVGLYVPPMIWGTQWKYSEDAILLVLASHPYEAGDYIRDYEEFLAELSRGPR